ncbi:MAG: hypothetical protein AB1521_08150 [Bacteroidota bacterium]
MKTKIIISVFLIVIVNSCDLFTTREPESPENPSNNLIPATTPEILFSNLESSIESKVLEYYLSCFIDQTYLNKDYLFIASGSALTQYPVLSSWDLNSERQYFNNLSANLGEGSNITITFSEQTNNPQGDSSIYSLDYSMNIVSTNTTIAGDYKGSALFKIFLDSRNQWVIVEWQDIKKENFSCWSDLKGKVY